MRFIVFLCLILVEFFGATGLPFIGATTYLHTVITYRDKTSKNKTSEGQMVSKETKLLKGQNV